MIDELIEYENRPCATQSLINSAIKMRAWPTHAERDALQKLQPRKVKFLHQVVFGFYIYDFVIPSKLLVVEIDGSSHEGRKANDFRRDQWTNQMGLRVLRIPNDEARTIYARILEFTYVQDAEAKWAKMQDAARKRKASADEREKAWLLSERKRKAVEPKVEQPKRRTAAECESEILRLEQQIKELEAENKQLKDDAEGTVRPFFWDPTTKCYK